MKQPPAIIDNFGVMFQNGMVGFLQNRKGTGGGIMARWKKGESGNPNGRAKRGLTAAENLQAAIACVEKEDGFDLMKEFVRMARREPSVMVALQRKLLADLKAVDLTTQDKALTEKYELPASILEILESLKCNRAEEISAEPHVDAA